ncbi:hypothetical protein QZH56_30750 [Streptomyces olivoreticuli]|uniref:hypothetical protein n=1 Tax=Streptomyces olivoreticuli TaxID=68246 RepID=UPI00265A8E9C|nr:hypothetical protein [Streptomyces olivoreticuli]WKK23079.1 hypothetical protein QZH56_30750 [Streptomyces olivoreticuli]
MSQVCGTVTEAAALRTVNSPAPNGTCHPCPTSRASAFTSTARRSKAPLRSMTGLMTRRLTGGTAG